MKAVMNIDVELRSCIEIPDDVAEAMKHEDASTRFAELIKKQVGDLYDDANVTVKVYRMEVVE
jgi:hypothetical protein